MLQFSSRLALILATFGWIICIMKVCILFFPNHLIQGKVIPIDPFDMHSSIIKCFSLQQLWLDEINHVIYLSQKQLMWNCMLKGSIARKLLLCLSIDTHTFPTSYCVQLMNQVNFENYSIICKTVFIIWVWNDLLCLIGFFFLVW